MVALRRVVLVFVNLVVAMLVKLAVLVILVDI